MSSKSRERVVTFKARVIKISFKNEDKKLNNCSSFMYMVVLIYELGKSRRCEGTKSIFW